MRFALLAGDHARDFVVIGGLNPDFLAPGAPTSHQGTTDVDLLFALGFDQTGASQNFAWLDAALDEGGFTTKNGWRWEASIGDALIQLEFLCDVWDHTADTVTLPGSRAVASKLAGPAAALAGPVLRELEVSAAVRSDFHDAPDTVALRFANLGGYLLAKAAAAQSRMLAKDKYDLMYVTLYNDRGGAAEAARAVAEQLDLAGDAATSEDIVPAMRKFLDPDAAWAGVFASTMVSSGDDATEEQLRRDAAVGARRFLDELDALEVP